MELIFHLNSMLRVCGSFRSTASKAHAMSRLECGYMTEKLKLQSRWSFRCICPEQIVRLISSTKQNDVGLID
jgi:hypothetical protein